MNYFIIFAEIPFCPESLILLQIIRITFTIFRIECTFETIGPPILNPKAQREKGSKEEYSLETKMLPTLLPPFFKEKERVAKRACPENQCGKSPTPT